VNYDKNIMAQKCLSLDQSLTLSNGNAFLYTTATVRLRVVNRLLLFVICIYCVWWPSYWEKLNGMVLGWANKE